jgi:hypothetical protein
MYNVDFQQIFGFLWRITFWLYMTFWPAHKAMRSIAAGQNVARKTAQRPQADCGFSEPEPP